MKKLIFFTVLMLLGLALTAQEEAPPPKGPHPDGGFYDDPDVGMGQGDYITDTHQFDVVRVYLPSSEYITTQPISGDVLVNNDTSLMLVWTERGMFSEQTKSRIMKIDRDFEVGRPYAPKGYDNLARGNVISYKGRWLDTGNAVILLLYTEFVENYYGKWVQDLYKTQIVEEGVVSYIFQKPEPGKPYRP